jgi:NAD(P)H-dependent flavin oxidoreductase YrpB (nitropropane dioxygenase family)
MRTALCEQLGIEFPIVAFTHCRDVAAAVSKAGGLGVLGIGAHTPEQMEAELNWIENEIGDKPYGVDVLIPAKSAGVGDAAEAGALLPEQHKQFIAELLQKYDVPPLPTAATPPVLGGVKETAVSLVDIALAHPIRLVASALGPPPPHLIDAAHEKGVLVAALVGSVRHALRQKDAGVDIIVAQGYEAGGHTGEIATMVLVPEVVDAVAPLPVLAAGGIARGRQIAAAMALGAQGVWTGSVWLTTQEAETHPVVKEKFLRASSSDTVRSRATTGKPARQLRSAWTDAWDDPSTPEPLQMPLQQALTHEARARIARSAAGSGSGARELITYFVGQVVGSMNQVKPARQVVFDMVDEYLEVAQRFADALQPVTPTAAGEQSIL